MEPLCRLGRDQHWRKKHGHGAKFVCPISQLNHHLSSVLFVDDNDLLHIRLDREETVAEAHQAIQSSINTWGELLVATGGALKPIKCFYSLISFKWVDGRWSYEDSNHLRGGQIEAEPLSSTSRSPMPRRR